ncbi:MAG: TIR domain-containing protein [Thermoguttaceae bacterium]
MTSSLKSRFGGPDGRRRLIDAIKSQRLVEHDEALATAIIDAGELVEFETGTQLISQGDGDNDAYFIIDGEAGIFVNARPVATRTARDSVGEMALIDPSVRRAASVAALTTLTALKISEPKFKAITENNARVWRALAMIIADRLRQRNQFHRSPNDVPVLFIGSSVEGLAIAQEIQLGLKHDKIKVRPWSMPGVFGPGGVSIDVLMKEVDLSDFAAFVFGPDDKIFSREEEYDAPRDNVVFELGLFMGQLDRNRSFIIKDHHADIKIPTDLLAVTPITYFAKEGEDLSPPVQTICTELRKVIKSVGVR